MIKIFKIEVIKIFSIYFPLSSSRTKRSPVHSYFRKCPNDPNVDICLVCKAQVKTSKNTTNCWSHLKHHPKEYKKAKNDEMNSVSTSSLSSESEAEGNPGQNNTRSQVVSILNITGFSHDLRKILTKDLLSIIEICLLVYSFPFKF